MCEQPVGFPAVLVGSGDLIPFLWQGTCASPLSGMQPRSPLLSCRSLGEAGDGPEEHLPTLPRWVSAENEPQPCACGQLPLLCELQIQALPRTPESCRPRSATEPSSEGGFAQARGGIKLSPPNECTGARRGGLRETLPEPRSLLFILLNFIFPGLISLQSCLWLRGGWKRSGAE